MASERAKTLMGRIAVQASLITMDQLAEATREQGSLGGTKNLGEILVDKGFITPSELQRLIEIQKQIVARAREKESAQRRALEAPPSATADDTAERAAAPSGAGVTQAAPQATQAAAKTQAADRPASPADPSGSLEALLCQAVQAGASDAHVHAGAPIRLRIRGQLVEQGSEPLDPATSESLVFSSLTPEQRELFLARGEFDFCYRLPELGRFRANVYRQLHGVDGVYRYIPSSLPSLEELHLQTLLAKFTNYHQGMVLITGPASCGKSTTLAALVNLINEERAEHILTIEDPIEYLHTSKRCLVDQRNVHRHTESFARALRGALREDPDVIVIGELRDRETISLALTAAETGHFVLATLHTDSAIRTVDRLIGAFPPNQQNQVRAMLSESLRAVVSQRLVSTADGSGQVPALEILVISKAVGKMIRDNKTFQLPSVLQTGAAHGMCLLDHSLAGLVQSDVITRDEALRHCMDPKRFEG
jgi:twitching motility protein PilT